jgi:hypothetical protein
MHFSARNIKLTALGGLVFACLTLGSRVAVSIPTRGGGDGFLWALKILKHRTSFGEEVKQSVPCRRFTACKKV